ncbi:hypothetical protein BJX99DRAFT_237038 [Aspergillus californicus]
MDFSTSPMHTSDLAARACAQCRESKKKCDKKLPKCGRCDRLEWSCLYGEQEKGNGDHDGRSAEGSRNGDTESKLDEIIRRLDRLETGKITPVRTSSSSPQLPLSSGPDVHPTQAGADPYAESKDPGTAPFNCRINASLLRPSYMSFITVMNIMQTIHKEGASGRQIAQKYTSTIHTWMPLLSSEGITQRATSYDDLHGLPEVAILLLSMFLLTQEKSQLVQTGADHHPSYLLCKHLFSTTYAVVEVSWDLLRAGILLALFEHMHAMQERSKMTLGTCMTMLSLLLARKTQGDGHNVSLAERANIWWATAIIDRYINPAPIAPNGRFLISHGDTTVSPIATDSYTGIFPNTAPGYPPNPSIEPPWKYLPIDPTLAGEAKAAQILGEVQELIHHVLEHIEMECLAFTTLQNKIFDVSTGLKIGHYCPFHASSHSGEWTSLTAVLIFHCFSYQKATMLGLQEIVIPAIGLLREAVDLANMRAKVYTEHLDDAGLSPHEVSPSMITSLFLGALGEYLLEQKGELALGLEAQYFCKNLLIRFSGEWGLAREYLSRLAVSSFLIEEIL